MRQNNLCATSGCTWDLEAIRSLQFKALHVYNNIFFLFLLVIFFIIETTFTKNTTHNARTKCLDSHLCPCLYTCQKKIFMIFLTDYLKRITTLYTSAIYTCTSLSPLINCYTLACGCITHKNLHLISNISPRMISNATTKWAHWCWCKEGWCVMISDILHISYILERNLMCKNNIILLNFPKRH